MCGVILVSNGDFRPLRPPQPQNTHVCNHCKTTHNYQPRFLENIEIVSQPFLRIFNYTVIILLNHFFVNAFLQVPISTHFRTYIQYSTALSIFAYLAHSTSILSHHPNHVMLESVTNAIIQARVGACSFNQPFIIAGVDLSLLWKTLANNLSCNNHLKSLSEK